MADDLATVLDIVLACRRIERFVASADGASFQANEEKRWAVASQLSVIGEAVRRLSTEFQNRFPHIPWPQIAAMRNQLIHRYDSIDWSIVWRTATQDVPRLLADLEPLVPPPSS